METIINLAYPHYEEIRFKNYNLMFLYDKEYNFFWLLVNWESRKDIVTEILNKYCDDEVLVYLESFDGISDELNLKLLDLVFDNL